MKNKMVILVAVLLFATTVQIVSADDWPMFHHDLALSGYSTSSAPNTNDILWTYDTGSDVRSSPAIVNGILYIGDTDGTLYANDAYTGENIWTFQADGPIYSSPAVEDEIVYFLSASGTFYALDAGTGTVSWSVSIGGGPWDWSSPAVHNGKVFIGASSGIIYCFDATTGLQIWNTNIGGSPDSPISVANGKVFSGTHNFDNNDPTLVALDENTGAIIWTYDYHLYHGGVVGMINCNGATVADGDGDGELEVYFGVYNWGGVDDQAICLNEATGLEEWTADIGGDSTSTPAVHDGKVFIGSDDFNMHALDASDDGTEIWSFPTGGQVWSAPAVACGKVFFGSWDHTFYAVDEMNGDLIWSYYTGTSRIMGSPAVADGIVYVGNENGNIYAFGPIPVNIDIKPGSCPNPINTKAKGVLPVAVLGTEDFDAMTIDPATIQLTIKCMEGVAPLRWNYEDVATPFEPVEDGPCCHDLDGDGIMDLTLKFKTQEVVEKLGLEKHAGEIIQLTITGNLMEEFGGTPIRGEDCVWILVQ